MSISSGFLSYEDEDEDEYFREGDIDSDSAFYSVTSQTSPSLTSSIRDYIYENGRTYNSYRPDRYFLPNDAAELIRLDHYHTIFLLLLPNNLFLAPLPSPPTSILDIGTGTGVWALDAAERWPSAKVQGNDLSPTFPADNSEACISNPNLRFEIDDAELEWMHPPASFDLVHLRCMAASIHDWPALLAQALRATKPGGYIEFQDWCGYLFSDAGRTVADSAFMRWFQLVQLGTSKGGAPLVVAENLMAMMRAAGWTDVGVKVWRWPSGGWSKGKREQEIGRRTLLGLRGGIGGFGMRVLTRQLGWSKGEVDEFVDEVVKDIDGDKEGCEGKGGKYWSRACFIWARKPLEGEVVEPWSGGEEELGMPEPREEEEEESEGKVQEKVQL